MDAVFYRVTNEITGVTDPAYAIFLYFKRIFHACFSLINAVAE
jgi:hypothetical protein